MAHPAGALPVALDTTGRRVVFVSAANNLVPGDVSGADIFMRDRGATPACSYQLSQTVVDVPAVGGSAQTAVTTGAGCAWAATTFDSWIAATPASGSGPGSLGVSVAANDGVSRFGYFSVEGRRVLVRQSGADTNAPPTFERQGLGSAGQTFPLGAYP